MMTLKENFIWEKEERRSSRRILALDLHVTTSVTLQLEPQEAPQRTYIEDFLLASAQDRVLYHKAI